MKPRVIAVHTDSKHQFSKFTKSSIQLLEGLGVEGDAHCGHTVQHRSRVAADPNQPNLRQVHLIHSELFEELALKGFDVSAGQLGENITTTHLDLLSLPTDTILNIGPSAAIQITGLRNPCAQIDNFQKGLLKTVIDKDADGKLIRKAGIMGVVLQSGSVKPNDPIAVQLPQTPHRPLVRV